MHEKQSCVGAKHDSVGPTRADDVFLQSATLGISVVPALEVVDGLEEGTMDSPGD